MELGECGRRWANCRRREGLLHDLDLSFHIGRTVKSHHYATVHPLAACQQACFVTPAHPADKKTMGYAQSAISGTASRPFPKDSVSDPE